VFLSGGIDSSLVTAYAAAERPGITTISARFEQASHDESAYARAVAERWRAAMWAKPAAHGMDHVGLDSPDYVQPERSMSAIGG
jgi:7-cyano-7-deazaguanine synthase in queuosine biosynthesis